jgi:hypothetical protein
VVSPSLFGLLLTVGAFLLALWVMARFAGFGPQKVIWAVVQVGIAVLLLQGVLPVAFDSIDSQGLPGGVYLQVFGVALPLLVYAFLTGGWVTRAAMGLLR